MEIFPFPMPCKICEMILLNRLENFAGRTGYFSKMQSGFQKGSGCVKAPFTVPEIINHMFVKNGKIFSCFLDSCKTFDTLTIDELLHQLFSMLNIKCKMWLPIKYLYSYI